MKGGEDNMFDAHDKSENGSSRRRKGQRKSRRSKAHTVVLDFRQTTNENCLCSRVEPV